MSDLVQGGDGLQVHVGHQGLLDERQVALRLGRGRLRLGLDLSATTDSAALRELQLVLQAQISAVPRN